MYNFIKAIDNVYNSIFNKKPIISNISYYQLSKENQEKYSRLLKQLDKTNYYPTRPFYQNICDLAREVLKRPDGELCDYCGYRYEPDRVRTIYAYDKSEDNPYNIRRICSICGAFKETYDCPICGKPAEVYALYYIKPIFSMNPHDDSKNTLISRYDDCEEAYRVENKSDYDNPIIRKILKNFFTDKQIQTMKKHHGEYMCVECLRKLGFSDNHLIPSNKIEKLGMKTGRKVALRSLEYTGLRKLSRDMLRTLNIVLKGIDTYSDTIPVNNNSTTIPPSKAIKMISAHFDKELFYLLDKLYIKISSSPNEPSLGHYQSFNMNRLSDLGIVLENNASANTKNHSVIMIFPIANQYGSPKTIEAIILKSIYTGKYLCPITNQELWETYNKNGTQKYYVMANIDNISVEKDDNMLVISFEYNISIRNK